MIHLNENLYIDADKYQFILKRKRIADKGKFKGQPVFKDEGYYPTLSYLLSAVSEMKMYELVQSVKDLSEVQRDLKQWAEDIKSPLVCELKKAIKNSEF